MAVWIRALAIEKMGAAGFQTLFRGRGSWICCWVGGRAGRKAKEQE